ncbi:MAG: hypothetical protein D6732_13655, partial [Methanobacteriota archaeon]
MNLGLGDEETKYKFFFFVLDTETNLSYFGARYYDGEIGRWWSVDALAERLPDVSPFAYALNNPIRLRDVAGLFPEDLGGEDPGKKPGYYEYLGHPVTPEERFVLMQYWLYDVYFREQSQQGNVDNSKRGQTNIGLFAALLEAAGTTLTYHEVWLYMQGWRRGTTGNYQLTGRNLSLFGRMPMTTATKPITGIGMFGRGISAVGRGLSIVNIAIFEPYQVYTGKLSFGRYIYHFGGTGLSLYAGYMWGGSVGITVGMGFIIGEMTYNGLN